MNETFASTWTRTITTTVITAVALAVVAFSNASPTEWMLAVLIAAVLIGSSVVTDRQDRPDAWLDTPVGCCECGTGGPHYSGDEPQVTRYVYEDWSSCEAHRLVNEAAVVLVDYGHDVEVTFRQVVADRAPAETRED